MQGGIHDQLGGGFHAYSTDERWVVPHFEKRAVDQAALLRHLRPRRRHHRRSRATPRSRAASSPTSSVASRSTAAATPRPKTPTSAPTTTARSTPGRVDEARAVADRRRARRRAALLRSLRPRRAALRSDAQRAVHRRVARGGRARARPRSAADVRALAIRARDKLLAARSERPQPAVDVTPYAGVSAKMARAYLEAEAALGVVQDRERALFALERALRRARRRRRHSPSARRRRLDPLARRSRRARAGGAARLRGDRRARAPRRRARALADHLARALLALRRRLRRRCPAATIARSATAKTAPGRAPTRSPARCFARPGHAHRRAPLWRSCPRARRRAATARVRRGHRRRGTYLLAPCRRHRTITYMAFTPRFLKHRGITVIQKLDPSLPRVPRGKVGLVLAGGAVAGGAFKAGGLRALDESLVSRRPGGVTTAHAFGLNEFDVFVGLSAGSVLAAVLSAGIVPDEIFRILLGHERDVRDVPAVALHAAELGRMDLAPAALAGQRAGALHQLAVGRHRHARRRPLQAGHHAAQDGGGDEPPSADGPLRSVGARGVPASADGARRHPRRLRRRVRADRQGALSDRDRSQPRRDRRLRPRRALRQGAHLDGDRRLVRHSAVVSPDARRQSARAASPASRRASTSSTAASCARPTCASPSRRAAIWSSATTRSRASATIARAAASTITACRPSPRRRCAR